MSAEMIAIIAWAAGLAAVLLPDQRAMRRDIKQLLEITTRMEDRLRRMDYRENA